MTRSSKDQKDQDEKKVLFELVKNSKEKLETISKHCGFSRPKTWRIIKQLEEKNMIWGYTAIFNEEKIGLSHFVLMLKRTIKQPGEATVDKIILRKLEGLVEELGITIESSFYVHGEYDWIITFTSMDIKHAKQIYETLITLHPGIIEKITIMQSLMFIRKQYILNPERKQLRKFL